MPHIEADRSLREEELLHSGFRVQFWTMLLRLKMSSANELLHLDLLPHYWSSNCGKNFQFDCRSLDPSYREKLR
jgi:hypothetical protein